MAGPLFCLQRQSPEAFERELRSGRRKVPRLCDDRAIVASKCPRRWVIGAADNQPVSACDAKQRRRKNGEPEARSGVAPLRLLTRRVPRWRDRFILNRVSTTTRRRA